MLESITALIMGLFVLFGSFIMFATGYGDYEKQRYISSLLIAILGISLVYHGIKYFL